MLLILPSPLPSLPPTVRDEIDFFMYFLQMLFFEPGDDVPRWNAAHNDAIKIGKTVAQKIAEYASQADSQEVTENGTF